MYITYKYKLRNRRLRKLGVAVRKVNFVWNYCNQTSFKAVKDHHKFLSEFDLHNLTSGTSKLLKIQAGIVWKGPVLRD